VLRRTGCALLRVAAGHLSMISDPGAVTGVIIQAARAAGWPPLT